jgi:hypothetical protein
MNANERQVDHIMTLMQEHQHPTGLWQIFWNQTSGTQSEGTHFSTYETFPLGLKTV